jgi:hypothetical protein
MFRGSKHVYVLFVWTYVAIVGFQIMEIYVIGWIVSLFRVE